MIPINKILIALFLLILSFLYLEKTSTGKTTITFQSIPLENKEINLENKQTILSEKKQLNVPLINQMSAPRLYNGCEVTSLAMLLNYHGIKVTKNELANEIQTVPLTYKNGQKGNPNVGFVGDMVNGPGLGVYNGPIFHLAERYAHDKVVNLSGSLFTDLLKQIDQGKPVWIITTAKFAPVSVFQKWDTPQGTIDVTFSEHSVVMSGYDENYIYINDPYGYKDRKVERENFQKAWEQMGKQAIVID